MMKRFFLSCLVGGWISLTALNAQTVVAGSEPSHVFYGTYDGVAPADLLSTVLKKYEGKVVLVDLWATWCGPCRMAHKAMEPVKEELKDSDVVFVYMTSTTSPVDTWQKMITGISGEHYYLTPEQYSRLMEESHSRGIPTYLLFDRQGGLRYQSVGFPGVETIRNEIENALK